MPRPKHDLEVIHDSEARFRAVGASHYAWLKAQHGIRAAKEAVRSAHEDTYCFRKDVRPRLEEAMQNAGVSDIRRHLHDAGLMAYYGFIYAN